MYINIDLVLLLLRKWKLILPCTCCDGYDCCFVENSKLTAYLLYFSFLLTILQVFYIWDAIFADTPEDFDLCDFLAVSILITIKKLILAQEEIQTLLPVLKPFFTFEESKQIVHLAREIRSVWFLWNLDCNDLENWFLQHSRRWQHLYEWRRGGRDLQCLGSTFSSTDMDSSLWHTEKEVYCDRRGLLFSTSILPPTLLLSSSKSSILTNQYVQSVLLLWNRSPTVGPPQPASDLTSPPPTTTLPSEVLVHTALTASFDHSTVWSVHYLLIFSLFHVRFWVFTEWLFFILVVLFEMI